MSLRSLPVSVGDTSPALSLGRIEKVTKLVASACMQEAALEMKTTDPHTDIQVSCDGTWHRRGFSSKNGIVTVLSVNGRNSKVIDTETLANHCDACAEHKHKKGVAEFEQWHKTHTQRKLCEKNHTGSAGSMEPAGTETIFCRSVTKYGLRYTSYLGDGDSKLYSHVKNAQPLVYDNTDITKLKCCRHVQKRMGCDLTNKVSELKNAPFVYTGKTVKELVAEVKILKIPGHYGAAIRNNVGHLPAMKAVWAIWEHCNRQHDSCGSWCPSKKADGSDPNKNALLLYVMEAIKPIFSTLPDDSLLEKCLYGGTQNTNESFHHHMGTLPQNTFHGRSQVKLVVDNATVVCNNGELRKLNIFQKLNTEAGVFATQCFRALDSARISRACTLGMQQAKKQRQQRTLDNAVLGWDTEEFYLSGAHE